MDLGLMAAGKRRQLKGGTLREFCFSEYQRFCCKDRPDRECAKSRFIRTPRGSCVVIRDILVSRSSCEALKGRWRSETLSPTVCTLSCRFRARMRVRLRTPLQYFVPLQLVIIAKSEKDHKTALKCSPFYRARFNERLGLCNEHRSFKVDWVEGLGRICATCSLRILTLVLEDLIELIAGIKTKARLWSDRCRIYALMEEDSRYLNRTYVAGWKCHIRVYEK